MNKIKAPRTCHLPWSEVSTSDDKYIKSTDIFKDKQVIVSIKCDGENTSLYADGSFHARSIDSKADESRDWLHAWWRSKIYTDSFMFIYNKYKDIRLLGENMWATHTIEYKNLPDIFLLHSAWKGSTCLSWEDTVFICILLDIKHVPVIYEGIYNEEYIKRFNNKEQHLNDPVEGYVIRNVNSFLYDEYKDNVAKFVSSRFQIDNTKHWINSERNRNKVL